MDDNIKIHNNNNSNFGEVQIFLLHFPKNCGTLPQNL